MHSDLWAYLAGRRIDDDAVLVGAIALGVIAAAGLALLIRFHRPRRRLRRTVRGLLAAGAVLAVVLVANCGFGWVHTVRALAGFPDGDQTAVPSSAVPQPEAGERMLWQQPAIALAPRGRLTTVWIPSTHRFAPRPAQVYLPAAAEHPQPGERFPVLMMLSGQPGSPEELFRRGRLDALLDAYAAAHGGRAPIVVAPDQLQRPDLNTLCVDSPMGDAYSYLTDDVVTWTRSHLPVTDDHRLWAVGGFSEGATCAVQLGLRRPDLFPTFLDIDGERAPAIGDQAPNATDPADPTVSRGFGGDVDAYRQETPLARLAARRDWRASDGVFAFGELDSYWGYQTNVLELAAAKAGMPTQLLIAPGSGHDWRTVQAVLTRTLPILMLRMGVAAP